MSAQCVIDQRPVGDGARLCRDCTRTLARDLRAVPDIVADLLITLSREDHVQPGSSGRGGSDTPLVYNDDASEQLRNLHFYLSTWTRCIAEDNRLNLAGVRDDALACAEWLLDQVGLIRRHDAADDLTVEIGRAVRDARRATDLAAVSSRFLVGPCPRVIERVFCDGDVLATITVGKREEEPPTMTCLRCQHVWPAETWLRAGKLIKNRSEEIGWSPRRRTREVDA